MTRLVFLFTAFPAWRAFLLTIGVLGFVGSTDSPGLSAENRGLLPSLLGSCRTSLAGSSYERITNIRKAVEKINGVILQPGEEFLYNRCVGPRRYKTGFLPAPAIVFGNLKPVIGGGICQVSSTLYNAVLLSDLTVVERHRHHTPVNYLPLGLDATISWGAKDFRFRNTRPGKIELVGTVSDETLLFEIYGENPLKDDLRLETEIEESPSPFAEEESVKAIEITVYRVRERQGKPIEKEYLYKDFYPARILITEDE